MLNNIRVSISIYIYIPLYLYSYFCGYFADMLYQRASLLKILMYKGVIFLVSVYILYLPYNNYNILIK